MAAPDDTAGKPAKKSVMKPTAAAAHSASQPERPSGTPAAVTAGGLPPRLIWLIVGIIVVAVAVIVGIWVYLPDLFVPDNVQPTDADPNARVTAEISARSPLGVLSGAVMAAAAAAIGVVVSHHTASLTRATLEETRRSNDLTDQRAVAGARDERFTKAVEQLGHTAAAVRLGAMHSLARLAGEDRERVPTVIDILCAYLRQPFHHPDHDAPAASVGAPTDAAQGQDAGEEVDGGTNAASKTAALQAQPDGWTPADERERELRDAEAEVRRTAQRLITATLALLDEDAPPVEVNLRGAKLLDDFLLTGQRVGRVDLTRVYLTGTLQLGVDAHVHGSLLLGEGAYIGGGLWLGEGAHIDRSLHLGEGAHINGDLSLTEGAHIDRGLWLGEGAHIDHSLLLGKSAHITGGLWLRDGAHIDGYLLPGEGAYIDGGLHLGESAHITGLWLRDGAHIDGYLLLAKGAHIDAGLLLGEGAYIDGLRLEESAYIDGGLLLGEGAHIDGYLLLGEGAHMDGLRLREGAYIGGKRTAAEMDEAITVGPGASIGGRTEPPWVVMSGDAEAGEPASVDDPVALTEASDATEPGGQDSG